jgi:capsular polysaccharide biosynthesis protein
VSRKKVRRRRLANERELEKRLQGMGFRVLLPEDLPFEQQVSAFARARLIVAPHGAGLANLVFCNPGVNVIELFHPEHPNECYRRLAGDCGLGYQAVFGRNTLSRPSPDDRAAEFAVNIEMVLQALALQRL